jgi:broad specificity phosphatase PhoE
MDAADAPTTRLVLVRHGESRGQEGRFVAGHDGCKGLSDRGRSQVTALRDRLASTGELGDDVVLYASVMPRAVETATILAPALGDPEVRQDCDLCEFHPGIGDGLPWAEFDARFPRPEDGAWDPDYRRVPGGDTWNEMTARVSGAVDRLIADHGGRTIVVACHGGPIVQMLFRFLAIDVGDRSRRAWFNPENASLTELRQGVNPYQAGTLDWELVRFNDVAHLVGATDLVS